MAVNLAQDSALAMATAQDALALRRVFETIAPDSCPHTYNFHLHTVCSDGKLQPEQVLEQAIALGLQGLAITDHHSVSGFHRAQQWMQHYRPTSSAQPLPWLWTGIEVNANLLGDEVHILGYAFDPDHAQMQPYLQGTTSLGEHYQAVQAIAAIQQAGGIAVLAHPARYRKSATDLIEAAVELGIDGVETYYAYNNPSPWEPSAAQTREVKQLSEFYGLLNTCGTDTHGLSLIRRL